MSISGPDLTRIAAAATVSVSTVRRIYRGEAAMNTTRARTEQAARELGLPLPPAPADAAARSSAAA